MSEKRKKKIVVGFLGFLVFMWLCTVISKSIYVSKLPVVTTAYAEEKYVEHIVEAEGIVIAGNKNPISVMSGLRIDNIAVQEGDRVEEGDILFTVDITDLEEIMEEKQQQISEKELTISRQQVQISKQQLQIDALIFNGQLAAVEKALEEQRAREDYDALARHEDTLVGRASNEVSEAESELESHEGEEGYDDEALRDALQAAAYAEGDAKWERYNTMKDAQRKIEDITVLPEEADPALEVSQLELSEMQMTLSGLQTELSALEAELAEYQEIKEAEGRIMAEKEGLITDIYISIGNRTPDTAVMLFADDTIPCQFKAVIDKEQKKYISLNDTISLKLDGSSRGEDFKIDYLIESKSIPGSYEIYINLSEGMGTPGLSGTMSRSEAGEKHLYCVSPMAVHTENTESYVYVVKERKGILGMEYYVEQIYVKVVDKNDNWAALEGALDENSRIVVSSTAAVRNGDVVRF